MEDPAPSASPLSPQDQARIRRERRQAKVKAGGTSRLNRITSTQGTNASYRDEDSSAATTTTTTTTEPPPRADDSTTPDPPEIDISQHHYEPKSRQEERAAFENIFAGMSPAPASFRNTASSSPSNFSLDQDSFAGGAPSDAELRQMMMMGGRNPPMFQQQQQPQGGFGDAPQEGVDMGMGDAQQDPMMQMMQQIMGGAGGMPGMPGMMGQQVHPRVDTWAKWWKMLHAFGAVFLALWALRSTGWRFSGSLSERVESAGLTKGETPLFWYFTTMELVLQSSRFFLEKGRPPPGSWLSTIGGFLPHPFGTFLITLARYSVIWTTIMADAGVLIFCLGVAAWWNK